MGPFQLLLIGLGSVHLCCTEARSADPYAPVINRGSDFCNNESLSRSSNFTQFRKFRPSIQFGTVVLVFLLIGLFSSFIGFAFHAIRRLVYKDTDALDVTFDAGGKLSVGMIAASLVSQNTWTMDLLYPTTTAVKYGISGPYWYAVPCLFILSFLAFLSLNFKIRAPGAKTIVQVIRARFGKAAHITFCVFALLGNVLILACLIASGCDVLSKLVQDFSQEMCAILLTALIGSYTTIGGLGATLFFCYVNTVITFIGIMSLTAEVYFNPNEHEKNVLGSVDTIYHHVSCVESLADNSQHSYLTFKSQSWLYVCLIVLSGYPGLMLCDQSNWQCTIATKPLQSSFGIILASLTFFAIPLSMGTSTGLAYIGMSSAQGEGILAPKSIDQGLAAPIISRILLGSYGEYLTIVLLVLAIMSTGSSEVLAVVSVLIYDVYQIYIQPFRPDVQDDTCILCQKPFQPGPCSSSMCRCTSLSACAVCTADTASRNESKSLLKPHYACAMHGEYRRYLDNLLQYKNWGILWATVLMIPLQIFCNRLKLNLSWFFSCLGLLMGPAAAPLIASLLWARTTGIAVIISNIVGVVCAVTSWLSVASTYPGGLYSFIANTGENIPVVVGNLTGFFTSAVLLVLVTLVTSKAMTEKEVDAVWEKTRNIDNPLYPWNEVYREEFGITSGEYYHDRPPAADIERKFRKAKILTLSSVAVVLILFVVAWPLILSYLDVMSETAFKTWITIINVWALGLGSFIIVCPIVQEFLIVYQEYTTSRKLESQSGQGVKDGKVANATIPELLVENTHKQEQPGGTRM